MRNLAFLLTTSIFIACGEKESDTATEKLTSTDVSLFDQTCTADTDCMTVTNGDLCGCACENSSINVAEADAWREHYDEVYETCDPTMMPDCAACPPAEGYCDDGTCQLRMASEPE